LAGDDGAREADDGPNLHAAQLFQLILVIDQVLGQTGAVADRQEVQPAQ